MTVAELHLGVLCAEEPKERARRLETVLLVEGAYEPIPISTEVARRFAELVAALRAEGRRAPVIDALIAATAVAHGLVLYTLDVDFATFPGVQHVLLSG